MTPEITQNLQCVALCSSVTSVIGVGGHQAVKTGLCKAPGPCALSSFCGSQQYSDCLCAHVSGPHNKVLLQQRV